MTTRERREARAAKRQEWAEGREEKAEQAFESSHDAVAQMPLGEPIHPGATGRRQRAAIRRSQKQGLRGIEHADMASKHRHAADAIGRELDRSVYSDDADAIERLAERIAENEAKRDAMKARNAAFRKANKAKLAELTSYERDLALPHQAFELTNLGARIRRDQKRLDAMAVPA